MKATQEINQIATIIRKAWSSKNLTQQQLADKCGIPKYRIAKAENAIGDVLIYILRTIIEKGLGGQFNITFEF